MPYTGVMPTAQDCAALFNLTAPDSLLEPLLQELDNLLQATIADLQSPVGPRQSGGTGREFTPVTETRLFDGLGLKEQPVFDIVPGTAITVMVNGAYALTDVAVRQARPGYGHNILYRQQLMSAIVTLPGYVDPAELPDAAMLLPFPARVFPPGLQNIAVNTTWGFAAAVPRNVYEAVRSEVCYRAFVSGVVGLNGVGEDITVDDFELNTSVGAINFKTHVADDGLSRSVRGRGESIPPAAREAFCADASEDDLRWKLTRWQPKRGRGWTPISGSTGGV